MDGFPIDPQRLQVREFTPDDRKDVLAYRSDADVMTYILDLEGPLTKEQARQCIAENTGDQARAFVRILKGEGQLIGHMLFHPWFGPRTHEVGWALHRRYHRQGYATEAAMSLPLAF